MRAAESSKRTGGILSPRVIVAVDIIIPAESELPSRQPRNLPDAGSGNLPDIGGGAGGVQTARISGNARAVRYQGIGTSQVCKNGVDIEFIRGGIGGGGVSDVNRHRTGRPPIARDRSGAGVVNAASRADFPRYNVISGVLRAGRVGGGE